MRNPDGPFGKCPQCNITLSKDRTRELCKENFVRCYNDTEDYRNILGVRVKHLPKHEVSFKGILRKVSSTKHIHVGKYYVDGVCQEDEIGIQVRLLVPIKDATKYHGFKVIYERDCGAIICNTIRFKTVTLAQIANTFMRFIFKDRAMEINENYIEHLFTNNNSHGLSKETQNQ